MSKKILYLGNKLSHKGSNLTTIETLSSNLSRLGFEVYTYSAKKNKLLRLIDMLLAVVFHRKADILLIDTYSTSAFWFAYFSAKIAQRYHLKYIPILHGGQLPERLNNSPKHCKALFSNAYVNIAPSKFMYNTFKTQGFDHIICIPNALNLAMYPYKKRSKLQPKLLWVRAFAKIYNPILALKMLKKILIIHPNATLSMVGPQKDGSLEVCKIFAQKHNLPVTFTGKLPKEKWIEYAKDFDIFINTTTVDNTPISLLEAMALGLPVISTNVGGIPYLIEHEKNGILVKSDDANALKKGILKLINDPGLAEKLSENGRKTVEEYDWDKIKNQWVKVLNGKNFT